MFGLGESDAGGLDTGRERSNKNKLRALVVLMAWGRPVR
jgi:hypothetical protein